MDDLENRRKPFWMDDVESGDSDFDFDFPAAEPPRYTGSGRYGERSRFKVPGFDNSKEVYRFDEPSDGGTDGGEAGASGETGDGGSSDAVAGDGPGGSFVDSLTGQGGASSFPEMLSDVDRESGSEKYADILDEPEVTEEEIDAMVREELIRRGFFVHYQPETEESDDGEEEVRDIFREDLVSSNDPLIAKLEEEARKRAEEEAAASLVLSRKERRARLAAERKAAAEQKAAEKAALKAAEKRRALGQIEAERRMIAEQQETEAAVRKTAMKKLARKKRRELRRERRKKHSPIFLRILTRLLLAAAIAALSLGLIFLTMGTLGRSEFLNTRVAEDGLRLPKGADGEVTSDRAITYEGAPYELNSSRSNIAVFMVDPDDGGAAIDSALVISLNTRTGESSEISISADTAIEVTGDSGKAKKTTLRSAYVIGGGGRAGCEFACTCVSHILFGVPIHAYFMMDLGRAGGLAAAVGGIPAVATPDYAELNAGTQVDDPLILTGESAEMYLRSYDYSKAEEYEGAEKARWRLIRQRQFISGFFKRAWRTFFRNPLFPMHLRNYLRGASFTNLNATRQIYLISAVIRHGFKDEAAVTAPGHVSGAGSGAARYSISEQEFFDELIDIFFVQK